MGQVDVFYQNDGSPSSAAALLAIIEQDDGDVTEKVRNIVIELAAILLQDARQRDARFSSQVID